MNFIDYKCPNCGGSIKISKGDSMGVCENCGANLSVEVEITDKLFRAFDLISVRRFVGAASILNDALQYDVKNGQLYLGLLMCDTECATPIELATTKYGFENNPNYKRAIEFLSNEQKKELEDLCTSNQIFLKKTNKYPTEKMIIFLKQVNKVYYGNYTLIQLYSKCDFSSIDEKSVIEFYLKTSKEMETIMSNYDLLSNDEKNNLHSFDNDEYISAIEIYNQIKSIIKNLSQEELDNVLKPSTNDKLEDDEKNNIYGVDIGNYDEIESTLDTSTNDISKNNCEENSCGVNIGNYDELFGEYENDDFQCQCLNLDKEINELVYELKGLSIFDFSTKKKIKDKIKQLNIEKNNIYINEQIKKIKLEIESNRNELDIINNSLKKEMDSVKNNFDRTPFTAFAKRKELKDTYKNLNYEYKLKVNNLNYKISEENKEITYLEKQIIKK